MSSNQPGITGGSAKRLIAGMPQSNVPIGTQQQQQVISSQTQLEAMRSRPVFYKKKSKLKDKIIPQSVRELVPESQSYMDLLTFERKLDATIMRKRLDIQEALKRLVVKFYFVPNYFDCCLK